MVQASALTASLTGPRVNFNVNNAIRRLNNIGLRPTWEDNLLVAKIIKHANENTLLRILENSNLNERHLLKFERAWLEKVIDSPINRLHKLFVNYKNYMDPMHARMLRDAYILKLIKNGSVNQIKKAFPYAKNNQKEALMNTLFIRKLTNASLRNLINHFSGSRNTRMGRATVNSFQRELQRRLRP